VVREPTEKVGFVFLAFWYPIGTKEGQKNPAERNAPRGFDKIDTFENLITITLAPRGLYVKKKVHGTDFDGVTPD